MKFTVAHPRCTIYRKIRPILFNYHLSSWLLTRSYVEVHDTKILNLIDLLWEFS